MIKFIVVACATVVVSLAVSYVVGVFVDDNTANIAGSLVAIMGIIKLGALLMEDRS